MMSTKLALVCLLGYSMLMVNSMDMSRPRGGSMPGGPVDQSDPEKDKTFMGLAKEAVIQYNKNNPNQPPYVLKKIVKATTQVVSGILYRLELEIVPESSNGPSKNINVVHVSKSWISQEKTFEITEI